jgi:hypothetical protein
VDAVRKDPARRCIKKTGGKRFSAEQRHESVSKTDNGHFPDIFASLLRSADISCGAKVSEGGTWTGFRQVVKFQS